MLRFQLLFSMCICERKWEWAVILWILCTHHLRAGSLGGWQVALNPKPLKNWLGTPDRRRLLADP